MFLARKLIPMKVVGPLLAVGVLAAIFFVQPSFIIDPLTRLAQSILDLAGIGAVTIALFALGLVAILLKKPLLLIKKLRLLVGLALLLTGAQGIFAYFDANLPYFGLTNLGGELGQQVQGTTGWFAFARIGVVLMFAVWFLLPT